MSELRSQKCIILGGAGFIGTNLCRALAGKVETLRAYGRRQVFKGVLEGVDWVQGDFSDSVSLASAIEGYDTVFHLVSTTTPASANVDMIADIESNVIATLRLLEVCKLEKVRRVIFVSSGGTVYGKPEQIPTPESAQTAPIAAYGISKLAIEKYLALYEHLHGLEYRILRLANPYGAYQTAQKNQGVIAAFLRRSLIGKPVDLWGDGSVVRDYVYVDDVVNALILAAQHEGATRIFNIGSGKGYSLSEIISTIESIIGEEVDVNQHEARPVDVPCSILDISLASAKLGWHPHISLLEGLKRTIDWQRENL